MPFPSITPSLVVTDQGANYAIQDNTTYTSPSRANLGVKPLMVIVKADGTVEFQTTSTYNPISDSSFNISGILKDSKYTLFYWIANKKTGAETPALNDFVYNSVSGFFERWNGSAWVEASNNDFYTLAQSQAAFSGDYQHNPDFTKALNYVNKSYVIGSTKFSKVQLEELSVDLSITQKALDASFVSAPSTYQQIIENMSPVVTLINSAIT